MGDVDNSYRGLSHVKMTDLVGSPSKIEKQAKEAGHTGSIENPVLPKPEEKVEEKKAPEVPKVPALSPVKGVKGRAFLFKATGERVTVVREKVGNTYDGTWIHEVIGKEGRRFLASMKQLVDLV